MSDKAEAFHESLTHPFDIEGQDSSGHASPAMMADETVENETAEMVENTAQPSSAGPDCYGPVPRPVKRPLIFDRVYPPDSNTDLGLKSASPSFSISAQCSASSPVNTMSSEPRGEQLSILSQDGLPSDSPVKASYADSEATTIAVESQCDAPSLNEISEVDISGASRDELMIYHSELMGWIRELERALQDCQADLKAHLHQYQSQEQLLEQRTEVVSRLEDLNTSLNQEVDAQQKAHQRQTILVETLQAQLDSSQERVAQMERDFSQVQRRCSDQTQQLLQAEGLCRDLKSRLSRQQRHTMQFKSALEKSLAVSVNDGDYDLGDVDLDAMDSSGELFPRSKPVETWSNPLDEAALSQALSGLDVPAIASASDQPSTPAVATKGNSLQLAFESPEDDEFRSIQAQATSQVQMAGNAAMGLVASQHRFGADDRCPEVHESGVETVFDPAQAKDLEATLKQERECILKGSRVTREVSAQAEVAVESTAPLGSHGVAFVPPIKPVLQEGGKADLSLDSEAGAQPKRAGTVASHEGEGVPDVRPAKKRVTSLAGVDLPSFPKP